MKSTLKFVKPYARSVVLGLSIKFIGSIAELFLPLILEYIIDDVVPQKDINLIIYMGLCMLACAAVALFGNIIANRFSTIVAANTTHDLRLALFSKTCYLKSSQVDGVTIPSLISRLTSDSYYVNQMVARTMRIGVRAPILLIGGIILTFTLNVKLALVLLATVPFVIVAIALITKKSIPCYFSIQSGGDDMVRSMQENISGVRVIKALSKGALESKKFEGVNDELTRREFKANKIMSLTNPLATLILNMGLVVVLVVGAYLSTPAGTVLAFLSYFTIILNAMLGISKIFVMLSRGVASANRIEEVLNLNENMPSLPHTMGDTGYAVQFKDVNFSYTGHGDVLSGINFEIKDGQTLGIIGPTGSGKSTIINLLMRFYDVDSGSVFVDGEDVRSMNVEELRKKFGVAFQNDFLMAADISKNIDYGRGLSPNDIDSAIICAQADEFVSHLEGGKNYMLAQKAANLSGGQKQRLIVARALAGKPHIIVLDDSSSALDYATDASLRKVLATEYASSTKIIIAQRISSVKNADLILVIEDGKIIGKGTHDYLLNTCSQYAEIYAVQMGCTA